MMTVEEINGIPFKLGNDDWTFCFYEYLTPLFLDDDGHLSESIKKLFLSLLSSYVSKCSKLKKWIKFWDEI